ncbi:MAG TPA: hypothetical protein VGH98_19075 [Gemmatimonadaceae bacterium]|jgi:hypothetical protein
MSALRGLGEIATQTCTLMVALTISLRRDDNKRTGLRGGKGPPA